MWVPVAPTACHHDAMSRWDPQRLAADIERVGARGLPYGELHTELAARIRHVMPVDAFCWHGLDPDTRLLTTANPVELMTGGFLTPETEAMAAGAVVTSEYLRDDVNTFADLAARRSPVAILSETTRGRPERSSALRGVPRPDRNPLRDAGSDGHPRSGVGMRGHAPHGGHRGLRPGRGPNHRAALAADRRGAAGVVPLRRSPPTR